MRKKIFGYSLVEIIVVVGILALMTTGGISALAVFRERREVLGNARSVAAWLRLVQVKASAVEVPSGCDATGVAEFRVSYSGNKSGLEGRDPTGVACLTKSEALTLVGSSTFVGNGTVIFRVPNGSASAMTIGICGYNIEYDLTVNESGSVSEPIKNSSGC